MFKAVIQIQSYALDIKPIIITCLKANEASGKVILNNDSIFVEEIIEDGEENLVFKYI